MKSMCLPRFRVRTLMVLVAVAASVFTAIALYQRRAQFLQRSWEYEYGEGDYLYNANAYERLGQSPQLVRHLRKRANYYGGLATKYRYSARYPWLPVAPDPPAPK